MVNRMTRKESRFVEEYCANFNGTRAAKAAGYSEKTANVIACELLKKPHIKSAIEAHLKAVAAENAALLHRNIIEYQRLAYFNPQDLFDSEGRPIPIEKLDPEVAAAIAGIEIEELWEGRGESRERIGNVRKYKLVDKKGALDSISRYLGMFNDNLKLVTPPGQPPIATGGVSIDASKLSTDQLKAVMEAISAGTA